MATYRLTCELLSTLPIHDVFAFFEDPRNLAKITPPWLRFTVTSDGDLEMRDGLMIEYEIRWMNFPMKWKSLTVEYQPPVRFADQQLEGPYARWHHHHDFEAIEGGTIIRDTVNYALPFGILGRLAHAAVVKRQLLAIFRYRQKALASMLPGNITPIQEPVIQVASD